MPKLIIQKGAAIDCSVHHQRFPFHFTSTSPYHCQACWFSLSFDGWIRSNYFIQWRSMIFKILYKIDLQVEARYWASWPSHLHHTCTAQSWSPHLTCTRSTGTLHSPTQGPQHLVHTHSLIQVRLSSLPWKNSCHRRTVAFQLVPQ